MHLLGISTENYSDITDLLKAKLPKTDEDAEAIGKGHRHKLEEIIERYDRFKTEVDLS